METQAMQIKELKNVVFCFAIGDALGAPFEFQSPSDDEIEERFHSNSEISFTDDTKLLLATMGALYETKFSFDNQNWSELKKANILNLIKWYNSAQFRGVGNTTLQALKQMVDFSDENKDLSTFKISQRGYLKSYSAGNGSLSRSLPLAAMNILMSTGYDDFIKITHLDDLNSQAVENLRCYLNGESLKYQNPGLGNKTGSFCFDCLDIAIEANEKSKTPFDIFRSSILQQGDNDSNAALAMGIYCLRNIRDDAQDFVSTMAVRFEKEDIQEIEDCIKKMAP